MRHVLGVGACVASALLVAACGGTTDAGAGSTAGATSSQPAPAIVSADQLDPGKYPTKPRPPLGTAGNPGTGVRLDAQRMADYVVGPWDVDDTLVTPYLESFYVLDTPGVLSRLGSEQVTAAAGRNSFVNGFASAREATDKAAMLHAVLRFADPAAATAASIDMNKAASERPIAGVTPTVAVIPGHPEAAASTYPFSSPTGSGAVRATIRSFTPHGPYVFMEFVQSVDGFDAAAALVAKVIDEQGPVIDEFKPAELSAFGSVEIDPTGLLARTLPLASGSPADNAVYTARGAAHFQSNPSGSEVLFKDTGVTEVAMADTNVYAAKDAATAGMVIKSFNDELSTMEGTTISAPVPNLPDSHCFAFPKAFYCVAPADRYAIEANGEKLDDLHQKVAAQYVMLTAKS